MKYSIVDENGNKITDFVIAEMTRENFVVQAAQAWSAAKLNRDPAPQYSDWLIESERNLQTAVAVLKYKLPIPSVVADNYT